MGRLVIGGTWEQPPEVIDAIVAEMKKDKEVWALVLDRWAEGKQIQALAKELGKRFDLEPEAFPDPKRPSEQEIVSEFLRTKFPNIDRMVGIQVLQRLGKELD